MINIPSNCSTPQKNIVIVGQGAIGLLYYHHFVTANQNVSLKTSPQKNNKQVSAYSFFIYGSFNEITLPLKQANSRDLEDADIIILCVKSYQVRQAVLELHQMVNANCLIVLAHNGMGVYEKIKNLFSCEQPVLALLTTHGSLRLSPYKVKHTGLGSTDIGLLSGSFSDDKEKEITMLFNTAITPVLYHQNIKEKQWLKLAVNCIINPITAINNIDNGDINLPCYNKVIIKTLAEIVLVAKSQGVTFNENALFETITNVANATAKNSSSMRCDLLAKRPTEIDFINGYIHALGVKEGIETPENTKLWLKVKALTSNYSR